MTFTETRLPGAYIIEPEPIGDERGFFARMMCEEEFAERDLAMDVVQANISYSANQGTLRGLHYQEPPHAENKMVRCTCGAIFDVLVDVRESSPTFLEWEGFELTAENRRMVYVPEGFAHGFFTLTEGCEVFYTVTAAYAPDAERGLRYDDPALGIDWPGEVRIVSEKDQNWPLIQHATTVSTI